MLDRLGVCCCISARVCAVFKWTQDRIVNVPNVGSGRNSPRALADKLTVRLEVIPLVKLLYIVVNDNGPASNLCGAAPRRNSEDIIVYFELLCTTALSFCSVTLLPVRR